MWRRRSAERLAALLLLAVAPAGAQMHSERVALRLDGGRVVEAELRRPADVDNPLPVVMLFGGFRGAATVLDAVPAGLPLVAASFDYPFDPPRRFRFPHSFADLPALGRGIDQTFEGIRLLSAHLRARPDIDARRITIVGASLGAPFAVVSAAELALPGVVVVHGFGRTAEVIAQQFVRKLEPRYGGWVRGPARLLAGLLAWAYDLPDAEIHAARLGSAQRALMIVAADDELIPAAATQALWQALHDAPAVAERIDEAGAHLRGQDDPRIADLVATALDWMRRVGLL
ncbi:hypothetical protein AAG565_07580 [Fontimonas sp. SYSU GA230001]